MTSGCFTKMDGRLSGTSTSPVFPRTLSAGLAAAQPLTVAMMITDAELDQEVGDWLRGAAVRLAERSRGADWRTMLDEVDRQRPDVVLLGLTNLPDSPAEAIQQVRRTGGAPAVIVVHTSTEPEVLLEVMRAGASEYVYPPFDVRLSKALERIAQERAQETAATLGKTVAFLSAKGGCGATTVACHVAHQYHQVTGQPALLVDFDLENGVVGFLTKSQSSYTVSDAIDHAGGLDASYWKALVTRGANGVDTLCSPGTISNSQPDPQRVQTVVQFARTQYGCTVMDLGRGLSQTALAALEATDQIFLVTTLDVPSLYGCQRLVRALVQLGFGRERLRLAVNRISRSTDLTRNEIEQLVGLPVSFELPDEPAALADAYLEGNFLPANHRLAQRIAEIARAVAGVPEQASKRRLSFSWLGSPASAHLDRPAVAARA